MARVIPMCSRLVKRGIVSREENPSFVNGFRILLSLPALFLIVSLSSNAFGVVECDGVDVQFTDDDNRRYLAEAPNDPVRYYLVGVSYFCENRISQAINYWERASDMEDIMASYVLGLYYGSDKTGDVSKKLPAVQENYDAALFYYERTADLIESTPGYPHGVHVDFPGWEASNLPSARTYVALAELYYTGYTRAVIDMLKNDVSYTDTIRVLTNMQRSAERCLKRPSLSVWAERQSEITHSRRVVCGAYKDFAAKALDLESRRMHAARNCETSLGECAAHQVVVEELVEESRKMSNAAKSVPKI